MKKLTIISSALILAGTWQMALAQPPGGGGGGGRGGLANAAFEDIDKPAEGETEADGQITLDELRAYFAELQAARGGGGGGGGRAGGGGGGGQDFVANIFASWDTVPEGGDGMISKAEFDSRPQGGGRGGFGGGPPPQ